MSESTGRRAILFDVNHTITNPTILHNLQAHALGRILEIDAKAFRAEMASFNHDNRGYRLDDHLAQYKQKLSWIRLRLLGEILPKAASNDESLRLIYPDALKALRLALALPHTDVGLITNGNHETQNFEIDLIKRILKRYQIDSSRLTSTVISGPTKGYWLVRQWHNGLAVNGVKYDRIVLADNSPVHFRYINETAGFVGVQIRRPLEDGSFLDEPSDKSFVHIINQLDLALNYLDEVVTP